MLGRDAGRQLLFRNARTADVALGPPQSGTHFFLARFPERRMGYARALVPQGGFRCVRRALPDRAGWSGRGARGRRGTTRDRLDATCGSAGPGGFSDLGDRRPGYVYSPHALAVRRSVSAAVVESRLALRMQCPAM